MKGLATLALFAMWLLVAIPAVRSGEWLALVCALPVGIVYGVGAAYLVWDRRR